MRRLAMEALCIEEAFSSYLAVAVLLQMGGCRQIVKIAPTTKIEHQCGIHLSGPCASMALWPC